MPSRHVQHVRQVTPPPEFSHGQPIRVPNRHIAHEHAAQLHGGLHRLFASERLPRVGVGKTNPGNVSEQQTARVGAQFIREIVPVGL